MINKEFKIIKLNNNTRLYHVILSNKYIWIFNDITRNQGIKLSIIKK